MTNKLVMKTPISLVTDKNLTEKSSLTLGGSM
jgi:hypothetical protein